MKEKKLEITDENYNAYRHLYDIQKGRDYVDMKQFTIWIALLVAVTVNAPNLVLIIGELLGATPLGIITTLIMIGFCECFLIFVSKKILCKTSLKNFKEDYPDIDININKEELKKALVKYKGLSKVEKNFEEQKEEHLSNYQESFRSMTPSEKIAFLEKEKEFWEQEQILEKYTSPELDIHKELGEKKI